MALIPMTKRALIALTTLLTVFSNTHAQKQDTEKVHFVCIQPTGEYHDQEHCPRLQMCSGGRTRRVKNLPAGLTPCKKCVKKIQAVKSNGESNGNGNGFKDIKNILGVKNRKQIADSLGTDAGKIHRPAGFTIRITGQPGSSTVNTIDFYMDKPLAFREDSLLSDQFFHRLGLQFQKCKADTIRSATPHPVTGKVKKDFSIEYRGCAVVEAKDNYEDISKYYYELSFLSNEADGQTHVEKIQLVLRVDSN